MKSIFLRFVGLSLAIVSMTFAAPAFANGFGGGGFGVSTVVPSLPSLGGLNINTNSNAAVNTNASNSTNNNLNTFSSQNTNVNANSNPNTNVNSSINAVNVNTNVGCGPLGGGQNCAADPHCNNPCIPNYPTLSRTSTPEGCQPASCEEVCQPAPCPIGYGGPTFNNTNNNAQSSTQNQVFNQAIGF